MKGSSVVNKYTFEFPNQRLRQATHHQGQLVRINDNVSQRSLTTPLRQSMSPCTTSFELPATAVSTRCRNLSSIVPGRLGFASKFNSEILSQSLFSKSKCWQRRFESDGISKNRKWVSFCRWSRYGVGRRRGSVRRPTSSSVRSCIPPVLSYATLGVRKSDRTIQN